MEIWVTSDTHYSHTNIAGPGVSRWKSGYRNFESVKDMNDTLVKNINSVVHENDLLYHLGDWSFGGHDQIDEFRLRINCKNIILILGNHDQHIRRTNSNKRLLFSEVHMQYECHQYGYDFVMSHYPIDVWNGKSEGAFHLFGHVHGNLERTDRSMDVGVDTNDMKPYNLETIIKILEPRL